MHICRYVVIIMYSKSTKKFEIFFNEALIMIIVNKLTCKKLLELNEEMFFY